MVSCAPRVTVRIAGTIYAKRELTCGRPHGSLLVSGAARRRPHGSYSEIRVRVGVGARGVNKSLAPAKPWPLIRLAPMRNLRARNSTNYFRSRGLMRLRMPKPRMVGRRTRKLRARRAHRTGFHHGPKLPPMKSANATRIVAQGSILARSADYYPSGDVASQAFRGP
jgi:hypothetical protein